MKVAIELCLFLIREVAELRPLRELVHTGDIRRFELKGKEIAGHFWREVRMPRLD